MTAKNVKGIIENVTNPSYIQRTKDALRKKYGPIAAAGVQNVYSNLKM